MPQTAAIRLLNIKEDPSRGLLFADFPDFRKFPKLTLPCGTMGEHPSGLFTLTAPTGTGKTLALLHFALRHCLASNGEKRRIIIVLPFLTLAEQNAAIYREIFHDLLVDHSQQELSDEEREFAARWRVPCILTTLIKFFESLFADKPGDCRKLHSIANSVVIFDEAQSLPPALTAATLQAVNALCRTYHCTMVFSTATQPDFAALPGQDWQPTEINPAHAPMYQTRKRAEVTWMLDRPTPFDQIADAQIPVPDGWACQWLKVWLIWKSCAPPPLCDRLTLALMNRGQLTQQDFQTDADRVYLNDKGRKKVLEAWRARKQEEIVHPFLDEKIPIGSKHWEKHRSCRRKAH